LTVSPYPRSLPKAVAVVVAVEAVGECFVFMVGFRLESQKLIKFESWNASKRFETVLPMCVVFACLICVISINAFHSSNCEIHPQVPNNGPVADLLWSDFTEVDTRHDEAARNKVSGRGAGQIFSLADVSNFCNNNGLSRLVRFDHTNTQVTILA
jgi:hypothetical protein